MIPSDRIVEVEWDDAYCEPSEMAADDLRGELLVHTVGYLVREDDRSVYVAAEAVDGGGYRSTTRIPRAMVREVRELTRKRARKAPVPSEPA